jgi:hypothetical protein
MVAGCFIEPSLGCCHGPARRRILALVEILHPLRKRLGLAEGVLSFFVVVPRLFDIYRRFLA